ncbi:cytochrome P450 [Bombardia bombarda]|uniref:Cytochrome P450 n=1 Tax=Bombardia bombarda TaxID=252184 RepID=A0AA40C9X3_9PEZI|nr:cytochrome P450 [Bombardia bombarda]
MSLPDVTDTLLSVLQTLGQNTRNLVLGLLGILIFSSIVKRFRRWYRLRHIPGPSLAGFSRLWLARLYVKGQVHEDWKVLADTYGTVVRIGPNEVLCTDVNSLYQMTSVRSQYKKDDWYLIGRINPDTDADHIFSMCDPDQRREHKKKIMPAYTARVSGGFEHSIDRGVVALIDLIERKYVASGSKFLPMDFAQKAHFYALDSLGEVAYSKTLGFLTNDKDMNDIMKINEATLPIMFVFNDYPFLLRIARTWPFNYLLPRDGDQNGFGAVMGHTSNLIDQRLAPNSKPEIDMLQTFIHNGLTREEMKEELTIQFFAGTDTIASAITMTFLFLLNNPSAYRKVQDEIDLAATHGLISSPCRDIEARSSLPYLQAVIREGLRIFPPVATAAFYKDVPEGGDTVNGHFLPEGTRIATGASIFAINRSTLFWGEDANVFRPERWLDVDEERLLAMTRVTDLIFGNGQFSCPGRALALIQMNKVFPELLRRYNFTLVNPVRPLKLMGALAWIAHDLWVRVEKR